MPTPSLAADQLALSTVIFALPACSSAKAEATADSNRSYLQVQQLAMVGVRYAQLMHKCTEPLTGRFTLTVMLRNVMQRM